MEDIHVLGAFISVQTFIISSRFNFYLTHRSYKRHKSLVSSSLLPAPKRAR